MVLMKTFRSLSRAEYFPVCLCKLPVTHDSPLIVSFLGFALRLSWVSLFYATLVLHLNLQSSTQVLLLLSETFVALYTCSMIISCNQTIHQAVYALKTAWQAVRTR